jgi:hypothetical protein
VYNITCQKATAFVLDMLQKSRSAEIWFVAIEKRKPGLSADLITEALKALGLEAWQKTRGKDLYIQIKDPLLVQADANKRRKPSGSKRIQTSGKVP